MTNKDLNIQSFIDSINGKTKSKNHKRKGIQKHEVTGERIREELAVKTPERTCQGIKGIRKFYHKGKESLTLPSILFFSNPIFVTIFMAIDDICFQINPILAGGLLH